jgi:hypothetical protein
MQETDSLLAERRRLGSKACSLCHPTALGGTTRDPDRPTKCPWAGGVGVHKTRHPFPGTPSPSIPAHIKQHVFPEASSGAAGVGPSSGCPCLGCGVG